MIELLVGVVVLGMVVSYVLIYGLRDAIRDTRTEQGLLIEQAVKREMTDLVGHTALIRASWDEEKEALLFHVENVGNLTLTVKSFRFFDENFVLLGEILNDYPPMPPGQSLSFSIGLLNHEGLDAVRVVVTLTSEMRTEDVLVRLPLAEEADESQEEVSGRDD